MIYEESDMKFDFPDDNTTIKFDDNVEFYRKLFNALPRSKAVDFITLDKEFAAFIEIKNCMGNEGNNRWRIFPDNQKKETSHTATDLEGRDSLDIEISEKTAMTLAALTGIVSFGESRPSLRELRNIADNVILRYLKDGKKKKYVILLLEGDFGSHTRSKKMIMSNLQRSIKQKLKWLNCQVSVVDSDTYPSKIFRIVS